MSPVQMAEKGRDDHERDNHDGRFDRKADEIIERALHLAPGPRRQDEAQREEQDKADYRGDQQNYHRVPLFFGTDGYIAPAALAGQAPEHGDLLRGLRRRQTWNGKHRTVNLKLPPAVHAALTALADAAGVKPTTHALSLLLRAIAQATQEAGA